MDVLKVLVTTWLVTSALSNIGPVGTLIFFFFFFVFFLFLWVAPTAYGGSQARGRIGAAATGLRQSHSNSGSEPCLQPTPQLTATPDR